MTNVDPTDVGDQQTDTGHEPTRVARGKTKTERTPTFRAVDYDDTNPGISRRIIAERYLLGRQLGIGGYGAVFSGVDEHTGDRVAIKLLSPALANDTETIARFHREAIAASSVEHNGIVDVLDFHVDPAGTSFIVMEYLDGEDLSEVLDREHKIAPVRALNIAAQCAEALAAAHEAHILHRDLKPANIFLTTSERSRDVVKIIDFGISKITQGEGRYTGLTSASKVVGTPYYMSPEQAQGFKLDGRTDVYSLGVILYRMLTGKRPFVGDSALDILTNHIEAKRVPPSTVLPALARYPKIDRVVLTAIAARPRTRFASMDEFRTAIRDCLESIDTRVAQQLDKTQVVTITPTRKRRAEPTPTTLGSASGETTRTSLNGGNRALRWGSIVSAAAAAALLTFWLTRSPASDAAREEPRPAAAPKAAHVKQVPPTDTTADDNDVNNHDTAPSAKRPSTRKHTKHQPSARSKARANARARARAKTRAEARAKAKARAQARARARAERLRRARQRQRKSSGKIGIKDW